MPDLNKEQNGIHNSLAAEEDDKRKKNSPSLIQSTIAVKFIRGFYVELLNQECQHRGDIQPLK